jgi:hypothetical protein
LSSVAAGNCRSLRTLSGLDYETFRIVRAPLLSPIASNGDDDRSASPQ